jgi:hypothetical protein
LPAFKQHLGSYEYITLEIINNIKVK